MSEQETITIGDEEREVPFKDALYHAQCADCSEDLDWEANFDADLPSVAAIGIQCTRQPSRPPARSRPNTLSPYTGRGVEVNLRVNLKSTHQLRIGNTIDEGMGLAVINVDCSDEEADLTGLPPGALLIHSAGGLRVINKITVAPYVKKAGWRQAWRWVRLFLRNPVRTPRTLV